VDIRLVQANDQLTLTVRDNGIGFDPAMLNGAGMGLTNLQRRAAKHGGNVHIASEPARGTTISITLPHYA
jgi:signal transduction histidine kinase